MVLTDIKHQILAETGTTPFLSVGANMRTNSSDFENSVSSIGFWAYFKVFMYSDSNPMDGMNKFE